jgi:hypothetical protein
MAAESRFGKNKNPTAGLAVGFKNSGEGTKTRPPRRMAAARLATGPDLNCRSQLHV